MLAMPTIAMTTVSGSSRTSVVLVTVLLIGGCASGTTITASSAPVAPVGITAEELRRDLFDFADDSMRGREAATPDGVRAAAFVAQRLASLGLEPGGDSGFFQRVPLTRTAVSAETRVVVTTGAGAARALRVGPEVVPVTSLGAGLPLPRRFADAELIFVQYGITNKKLERDDYAGLDVRGKIVVMAMGAPPNADSLQREMYGGPNGIAGRFQRVMGLSPAAIVLVFTGKVQEMYGALASQFLHGVVPRDTSPVLSEDERRLPPVVFASEAAASVLIPAGWPARAGAQFAPGTRMSLKVVSTRTQVNDYNVVGVVRGDDAAMARSFVAVGAHLDHDGIRSGQAGDSVANGADDDGSGTVAGLAIARAVVQSARTRRSWLFVFHAAEEKGLLGSAYFTAHPTVPMDSIVAQLNADMIGRNGDDSLYVVGPAAAPGKQSVVLGGIVDSVNAAMARPFRFDRSFDSPTHPEQIYSRSDHYHYAKLGVPIIFFTSGLHPDYHQVSDSPEKIGYAKLARASTLIWQVGVAVANRLTRPR